MLFGCVSIMFCFFRPAHMLFCNFGVSIFVLLFALFLLSKKNIFLFLFLKDY